MISILPAREHRLLDLCLTETDMEMDRRETTNALTDKKTRDREKVRREAETESRRELEKVRGRCISVQQERGV